MEAQRCTHCARHSALCKDIWVEDRKKDLLLFIVLLSYHKPKPVNDISYRDILSKPEPIFGIPNPHILSVICDLPLILKTTYKSEKLFFLHR